MLGGPPKEINFSALMTVAQFCALKQRADKTDIVQETLALERFTRFQRSPKCDDLAVERYLRNGWCTERLLHDNGTTFKDEALQNSTVWAFPQCYYSAFAVTLAFYEVAGVTHSQSHAAIIKQFGREVAKGYYPATLSFYASGGHKISFHNVERRNLVSSVTFDEARRETSEGQIAQFLNGTRQRDLNEQLLRMKLRTKANTPKLKFSASDRDTASEGLGITSLFSLLYRKRLKSNYHDIETFTSPSFDAAKVLDALVHILSVMNVVHEMFIFKAIGRKKFQAMQQRASPFLSVAASKRFENVLTTKVQEHLNRQS